MRGALYLFAAAAAVLLLMQQAQITLVDGLSMYHVTESLVLRHSFQVIGDPGGIAGVGGRYSKYGLALPVVGIPLYSVGYVVSHFTGHAAYVRQAFEATTMPLICAALVVSLYLFGRRLGATAPAALLVAVGAIAGTYLLPYTKDFFSEPLTALGLVVAFERLAARRGTAAALGLSLAILARNQEVVLVPVFLPVAVATVGWRKTVVPAVVLAATIAVVLGYDQLRFGSPLDSGYHGEGFTTPLLTGLGGLFLNPSKSIFLFAPVTLLLGPALVALWRRERWLTGMVAANLLITLLLAATWHSWEGGWSWGPRLLLPGVVPALACIAPWLDRKARFTWAKALLVAGFLVNASTLVVSPLVQLADRPRPFPGPGILRQVALLPHVLAYTVQHRYDPVIASVAGHTEFAAVWQVGVVRLFHGRGILLAAAGTLVLAVVAAWAARNAARELLGGESPAPAG